MKTIHSDIEKKLIEITQQFIIESGEGHSQRLVTMDASLHRHLGIDSLGRAELFSRIEKAIRRFVTTTIISRSQFIARCT